MSVYHTFYAEIKVNGKWFFLGPSVRTVEGKFVAGSLFWGKSYKWNNTFDVYRHFQRLVSMVEHLYAWFDDLAIPYGNGEYDGSTYSLSDIRIIGIAG